jgi:hypothetical protein
LLILIDGTDIVFHLAIYQQQWPNFCKQTKVNIPFVKWFNLEKILPFLQKKWWFLLTQIIATQIPGKKFGNFVY